MATKQRIKKVVLKQSNRLLPYLKSLNGLIIAMPREVDGVTTIPNYGTLGTSFTLTAGAGGAGRTGYFGANSAIEWYGADTRLFIAASAGLAAAMNALTAFTEVWIIKPDTAGESNFGRIATSRRGIILYTQFNGALTAITTSVDTSLTDAVTTTTTGLAAGAWRALTKWHDNAGDRKIYMGNGLASTFTEYAYSAQTAARWEERRGGK